MLNRAWLGLLLGLAYRALLDPRVARDLLSMCWSFRALGWYRRPPYLPVPPASYLRWRLHTAYGDEREVPPADDVVQFARWRRRLLRQ